MSGARHPLLEKYGLTYPPRAYFHAQRWSRAGTAYIELLEKHPDRIDLQMRAVNTLSRLIQARYKISPEEKKDLKDAITTVLKEVAIPLGLKFIP